jgi:hypothetical protein
VPRTGFQLGSFRMKQTPNEPTFLCTENRLTINCKMKSVEEVVVACFMTLYGLRINKSILPRETWQLDGNRVL